MVGGSWFHVVVLFAEAVEEVAEGGELKAAVVGVWVLGRGDFEVDHVELGVEGELVVRAGDFGTHAAEPIHEGHGVVGGDFAEEEAVFGGRGGGGPELSSGGHGR